jgi:hypothetical protein
MMRVWDKLKAALASGTSSGPPDRPRLDASSENALSASIKGLPVGERGWITFAEARFLFSRMDDQEAFGEMDEEGRRTLAAFAAESEHSCSFDFMPTEGRVYFTRK